MILCMSVYALTLSGLSVFTETELLLKLILKRRVMHPASPPQPTKALTFDVSCPPGASVDSIFDGPRALSALPNCFLYKQLSIVRHLVVGHEQHRQRRRIGGTIVPIVPSDRK
ncbi:hypothetical protein HPB47_025856 [Ixodes persulcatus]|uniref:Uncharacterized protein n=1 Tax=Ixodes persulcatus TaxID=34615 RepID=A0AC60Q0S0_IXOPE|nr:hypothetical protein HPB47_025856 [Ixodes persulcatus]